MKQNQNMLFWLSKMVKGTAEPNKYDLTAAPYF
jgi:hypothetical protein